MTAVFLLFAAALTLGLALDATRAEASLPRSADAVALNAASLEPEASTAIRLGDADVSARGVVAPDDALRLGFAEELCLLEPDHARAGFVLFERKTRRCERTYARNNPLKYVDPDGRKVTVPKSMRSTIDKGRAGSPTFNAVFEKLDKNDKVNVIFKYQLRPKPGTRLDTSMELQRDPKDGSLRSLDMEVNVPVGKAGKVPEIGHELTHGEEVLDTGKTLKARMEAGEKGIRKNETGYESDNALEKERRIEEELRDPAKQDRLDETQKEEE